MDLIERFSESRLLFINIFSLFLFISALAAEPGRVVISVDWEGAHLRPENLQAMAQFRRKHPDIPFVHFLNAEYFLKSNNSDFSSIQNAIQAVILPVDEIGLHIHAWKNLVEAAGVKFKQGPTFWGTEESQPRDGEPGHDVFISNYSVTELQRMIRLSLQILKQNGFTGIKSFRAGGWMAFPNVLEALAREGLKIDSSEVPRQLLAGQIRNEDLYQEIGKAWGESSVLARPHFIHTQAGPILEMPDNGGLADYVTSERMLEVFTANQNAGDISYLHFGFHQETAGKFLPQLEAGLEKIGRRSQLVFTTFTPHYHIRSTCEGIFN